MHNVVSRIKRLLQRDPLTRLANRRLFLRRVKRSLARLERLNRYWVAVIFLDLNNFKPINDKYGHLNGDRILVEVGRRLSKCLKPSDLAARLGGDKFTIFVGHISGMEEVIRLARHITHTLKLPLLGFNPPLTISANMGIVCTRDNCIPQELLQQADAAMYSAKKRNISYEIYIRGLGGHVFLHSSLNGSK